MAQKKQWEEMNRAEKTLGLTMVFVVLALVVWGLVAVVGAIANREPSNNESAEIASDLAEARQEEQPEQLNNPEAKEPVEEKQGETLADKVDDRLKAIYDVERYTELLTEAQGYPNLGYVTSIDDVNRDTIRVHAQADFSKEDGENLARNILVTVGFEIEQLNWVIVRGVDGLDRQVSRSSVPALR